MKTSVIEVHDMLSEFGVDGAEAWIGKAHSGKRDRAL